MVQELVQHPGWRQVVKPFLEEKIKNSWLDPRKASSKEDFWYQYVTAWGLAQACDELVKEIDQMIETGKFLERKRKGETDNNFKIGS